MRRNFFFGLLTGFSLRPVRLGNTSLIYGSSVQTYIVLYLILDIISNTSVSERFLKNVPSTLVVKFLVDLKNILNWDTTHKN